MSQLSQEAAVRKTAPPTAQAPHATGYCRYCGKVFRKQRSFQIYCSVDCLNKAEPMPERVEEPVPAEEKPKENPEAVPVLQPNAANMRYLRMQGYSNKMIAERCGCSQSAVRVRIGNEPAFVTAATKRLAGEIRAAENRMVEENRKVFESIENYRSSSDEIAKLYADVEALTLRLDELKKNNKQMEDILSGAGVLEEVGAVRCPRCGCFTQKLVDPSKWCPACVKARAV